MQRIKDLIRLEGEAKGEEEEKEVRGEGQIKLRSKATIAAFYDLSLTLAHHRQRTSSSPRGCG